jgi:hypothetical protein
MSEKISDRFTKVWVLFDSHHSPGPVPYATLGPIDQSVPYVPEAQLEEKCEALRDALKQNQENARIEAGLRAKIAELEGKLDKAIQSGLGLYNEGKALQEKLTALQSANSALLEERDRYKKALTDYCAMPLPLDEKPNLTLGQALEIFIERIRIAQKALAPTAEKQGGM